MNNIISLFARAGGDDSFESLLAPHIKDLYQRAYHLTGSESDAEDLLQDLLLELYGKQEAMRSAENLGGWLYRCLYHRFVDGHRRAQRRSHVEEQLEEGHELGAAQPDCAETDYLHQQVLRGMGSLTAVQRAVISLHDIKGHSLPELVPILELPLGTLKSHLHRARKRLKNSLELQPFTYEERQYR
jgi:RNA polymerase sigma-70 factor (ECF subfamily)